MKFFMYILAAWVIYALMGGDYFNIGGIAIGVFATVYLTGMKVLNA